MEIIKIYIKYYNRDFRIVTIEVLTIAVPRFAEAHKLLIMNSAYHAKAQSKKKKKP